MPCRYPAPEGKAQALIGHEGGMQPCSGWAMQRVDRPIRGLHQFS